MFSKVLVANRGEIALRVIRACKELGVKSVAVYSEVDEESLHVRFADEAICIGPAENKLSYLNIPSIISAAEITDAEAIHPGYGFLAENARFAEICSECGLKFIGPEPEIIRLMGDKAKARQAMKSIGLPIVPGSDGPIEDLQEAIKVANKIGYPVMIKAAEGGGGRGMRIVYRDEGLQDALSTARAESAAAFGSNVVYMEKYIEEPRHIEIQIIADQEGNAVHLGERECSIQRRHQKLVEETPSPYIDDKTRATLGRLAIKATEKTKYTNAGTFEFIFDQSGNYYFLEMNTRIQVEHPITEMVTGVNLIKAQIRVAAGEKLAYTQKDIHFRGHAIECRINAEDPIKFIPCPGQIKAFNVPGGLGVRVDTASYTLYRVPPHYDSMLAKLIVHAEDRMEAIMRMRRALEEFIIEGITTSIPLHLEIFSNPDFIAGNYTTSFINKMRKTPLETAKV